MRLFNLTLAALALSVSQAAAFEISFTWDGLKLCTSGNPNRVGSPAFVLKNVPDGTTEIRFKLVDLDVPSYNHGGGKVRLNGSTRNGQLPAGLFKYKSPCPPNGKHTYEWQAEARAGGKVLATTASRRKYP